MKRSALGGVAVALVTAGAAPACGDEGLWALPECAPQEFRAAPRSISVASNIDDVETVQTLTVIEATDQRVYLQADAEADPEEELYLDIDLNGQLSDRIARAEAGETLGTLGSGCDQSGYVRLSRGGDSMLLEAGNPWCPTTYSEYQWEVPPFFHMRPVEGGERCRTKLRPGGWPSDECCCVTAIPWEVTLTIDGVEEVLAIGQERTVTIDGRDYIAKAIHARELFDSPCTYDVDSVQGTAYLAPLE